MGVLPGRHDRPGDVVRLPRRDAAGRQNAILQEALRVGIHAVVWFAAFALFEGVAWTEGEYIGGLCAGVVALLLTLFFVNGIGFPSVAAYLWAAVGLVLAVVTPRPAPWLSRQPLLVHRLPVPVLLATAFGFFALVGYPPRPLVGGAARRRSTPATSSSPTDDQGRGPQDQGLARVHPQADHRAAAGRPGVDPNDVPPADGPVGVVRPTLEADPLRGGGRGRSARGPSSGRSAPRRRTPNGSKGYRPSSTCASTSPPSGLPGDRPAARSRSRPPKHPVNERMRARPGVDPSRRNASSNTNWRPTPWRRTCRATGPTPSCTCGSRPPSTRRRTRSRRRWRGGAAAGRAGQAPARFI